MSKTIKIFLLFLIISPLFWWQIINQNNPLVEYQKSTIYIHSKFTNSFVNTKYLDEFRWNDTLQNRPLIGHLFFNKSRFILDEGIKYLNILNPRFYFQSGSGQKDSPLQIEPIPFLLIFTSFLGIARYLKKGKYYILIIGLVLCLPSYLTGQLNFYFSFPIAFFYLYCSAYEVSHWKTKNLFLFLIFTTIYSVFLFLRTTYLLTL